MATIIAVVVLLIILLFNNRDREKAWEAERKNREWAFSLKHEKEKAEKELAQLRKSTSETIRNLSAQNELLLHRLAQYEDSAHASPAESATEEQPDNTEVYDDGKLPF